MYNDLEKWRLKTVDTYAQTCMTVDTRVVILQSEHSMEACASKRSEEEPAEVFLQDLIKEADKPSRISVVLIQAMRTLTLFALAAFSYRSVQCTKAAGVGWLVIASALACHHRDLLLHVCKAGG